MSAVGDGRNTTGAGANTAHRLCGISDEAGHSLAAQLRAVSRLGWRAIELRTVSGVPLAELSDRLTRDLQAAILSDGLEVSCLDSRIGAANWPISRSREDDVRELTSLLRLADLLGARRIRVMSYPNDDGRDDRTWRRHVIERLARLTREAEAAGVTLVHENCVGWAADSGRRAREMVRDVGSAALRLLFDTGNGLAYGYGAVEYLDEIADLVEHVHVKDGVRREGGVDWTLPDDGEADLLSVIARMRERGYNGYWSIEPHRYSVPHEGRWASDEGVDGFVEYGARLEALLAGVPRR